MNAIEKIIETLENYVVPSQLDDARAEHAALREVAEALEFINSRLNPEGGSPLQQHVLYSDSLSPRDTDDQTVAEYVAAALAKLAAVKGGQK